MAEADDSETAVKTTNSDTTRLVPTPGPHPAPEDGLRPSHGRRAVIASSLVIVGFAILVFTVGNAGAHVSLTRGVFAAVGALVIFGACAWIVARAVAVPPDDTDAAGIASARRNRIATLTTTASVLIVVAVLLSMAFSDHVWQQEALDAVPTSAKGFTSLVAQDSSTATTPPTDAASATTGAAGTPGGSSDASAPTPITVGFGFNRNVAHKTITIAPVDVSKPATLQAADFTVLPEDGNAEASIASIVGNPVKGANNELVLTVSFDMRRVNEWVGGSRQVVIAYTGNEALRVREWDYTVTTQSRLVLYGLAALPWIIVLAMYGVFDEWPVGMKRWWASLVAMGAATVAAYTAAGLRNTTWKSSVLAIGGLIAASYGAAVASAQLLKQGGHNLTTNSDRPSG